MTLPQIRLQPWYPGQMGVPSSDVQRGLRWEPSGIVLYVDENHPGATADADGTDPENPLNSIQTAITKLTAFVTALNTPLRGSVIVVGGESTIAESVTIPATAPTGCAIIGAGPGNHQPTWTAAVAAGTALTVLQTGWTIEGFTFEAGAEGTAILLNGTGSDGAYKTTIRNCRFDGLWGGLYGINFVGSPHRVKIENCEFLEWRSAAGAAFAIIVTDSSDSNPYECHIHNNVFWENENHVGSIAGDRAWNLSTFIGNVFHKGTLIPSTIQLDLRGGSRGLNLVTGNSFFGDYSNPGGYYDNAGGPGFWMGNFSDDTAEAEVDTTTGLTILPPAA